MILIIDVDANGNVTNVSVEKSSRNRDLDRAAMDAARKWRFNPSVKNGQKAAGRVRVPVDFKLSVVRTSFALFHHVAPLL